MKHFSDIIYRRKE